MTDRDRLTSLLSNLLKVAVAADAVVKADCAKCAGLAAAPGALDDYPVLRHHSLDTARRFFQQRDMAALEAALASVRPLLDVMAIDADQAAGATAA